MTKEDIAATISGKPPAPEGREIHSYSIDMNQMEPIVKSIFQDDRQAAYAETLAKLAKFYTNTPLAASQGGCFIQHWQAYCSLARASLMRRRASTRSSSEVA